MEEEEEETEDETISASASSVESEVGDGDEDEDGGGDAPAAAMSNRGAGIMCAPGRRPSQRGILVAAMPRHKAVLSAMLQPKMVLSMLSLPTSVLGRRSSFVNDAIEAVKDGLTKGTTNLVAGLGRTNKQAAAPVVRTYAGGMEAMAFVRNFDVEYGHHRPNFEKSSFVEAVSRAVREFKFLFAYLHSADHPGTQLFCQRTLCSQGLVSYVNANFISWGGDVRSSEGFQMSVCLRASGYPFCAVVAASSPQHLAVLQQVNGQVSADDLISVLRRTLEERGGGLLVTRLQSAEISRQRRMRDVGANHALAQEKLRSEAQAAAPKDEEPTLPKRTEAVTGKKKWFHFVSR